jgi:hypothetical protein
LALWFWALAYPHAGHGGVGGAVVAVAKGVTLGLRGAPPRWPRSCLSGCHCFGAVVAALAYSHAGHGGVGGVVVALAKGVTLGLRVAAWWWHAKGFFA